MVQLSEHDNDNVTVDVDGYEVDTVTVQRSSEHGGIIIVLDPGELEKALGRVPRDRTNPGD
jgi:archaellum component FlaG (FlaF/FlaG flagellin family)